MTAFNNVSFTCAVLTLALCPNHNKNIKCYKSKRWYKYSSETKLISSDRQKAHASRRNGGQSASGGRDPFETETSSSFGSIHLLRGRELRVSCSRAVSLRRTAEVPEDPALTSAS